MAEPLSAEYINFLRLEVAPHNTPIRRLIATLDAREVSKPTPASGGVHNHGPVNGPGVGCLEYLIGACRLAVLDAPAGLTQCWFCKGMFTMEAMIAGYDTWDEQRLACLACNERMSGNWRPTQGG